MRDGWEIKKLGDVTSIKSGKSIDAGLISSDTSLYPCYGGNGVRGFVGSYSHNGCFLIIGRVGALCGNIHLVKGKFYATEHALVVEIKDTNIYSEWLKYNLISLNLRSIAKGVAQPVISAGEVSNITVPVPPISEQERIVEELDLLSGIIEKQKQQLKEYDTLAQSIFYDMFGDGVGEKNKWNSCCIGDIYKFQYGKGNKIPENKGEYPCYGSNGQVGYHTDYNSEDSPIIGHIGAYAGIVNWASGKHYVTYNGVICHLKNKDFNPKYGFYLLRSQNYMENARGGAAQPFVSYDMLESPVTYIPPLSLQQEFASKIEAIDKQKELIKQSIAETETLFNSRMDFYFN